MISAVRGLLVFRAGAAGGMAAAVARLKIHNRSSFKT
jgi:glycerate kinase